MVLFDKRTEHLMDKCVFSNLAHIYNIYGQRDGYDTRLAVI